MSGMASSEATRIEYTLRRTPAATTAQTTARHLMIVRISSRIMALLIHARALQLVLGVDEKTAEGHDRRVSLQAFEHLRIELALNPCVHFFWYVFAVLLDVDDMFVALFDNRLVRNNQIRPLLDDNFQDIQRRIRAAGCRQRRLDRNARWRGRYACDICLVHGRLRAWRKRADALPHLDERGFRPGDTSAEDFAGLVDRAGRTDPRLQQTDFGFTERQRQGLS